MIAFIQYCLLIAATFILLLHSFVPHQHHNIEAPEPIVSACVHGESGLLGFLSEAFHLDLGAEHLENFKPVPKTDFAIGVQILASVLDFEVYRSDLFVNTNYLPTFNGPAGHYFTSEISLRGPPRSIFS